MSANGLETPLGTRLYIAASLFLLENGSLEGAIPWPLEIARWAAPAVLATAAVGTVLSLVRHRAWSLGTRRLRGHVVVIGLGDRGWRTARSVVADGRRVVVIERDPDNPHVQTARRLGVPVVVGSAAELSHLRAARLSHASRAIVLVGDTTATTSIADGIAELARQSRTGFRPEFCCFLAVHDADVARDLNALMHDQGAAFQREFFSLEERAGPVIVDRWGGLLTGRGASAPVVVIGSGMVARSVVTTVARHRVPGRSGGAPVPEAELHWFVRVGDRGVERVLHDLTDGDGGTLVHRHVLGPGDPRADVAAALRALEPPALLVVAENQDAEALTLLATADEALRDAGTVIVGVAEKPSLIQLLHGHERIEVFDVAEELGRDEQIARGRLETLGRALHDGYLRQLNRSLDPQARAAKAAYRPWAELSEDLRAQNYAAARAARGMLRGLGLDIVPRTPLLPAVAHLDADTVEALARAEHTRWFRSRNPGAPEPRWAQVDPVHAEQSRDQVRRLPEVLAAADLQITPRSRDERA